MVLLKCFKWLSTARSDWNSEEHIESAGASIGDHHHVDAGIENRHRNAAVMDSLTAFAAIGLTAVAWDGSLTPAGGRAFRHALDYREPYCNMREQSMVDLIDCLLTRRREIGNNALMLEAAQGLSSSQSLTAYAMASELMRSDGPYEPEERRHLDHLALILSIAKPESDRIDSVFDVLHNQLKLWSKQQAQPA